MPKNNQKSKKKSQNRDDNIKLIENDRLRKETIKNYQEAGNIYEFFVEQMEKSKAYVIKRTLNNTTLGIIFFVETQNEIYISGLEIQPQYQRKGWGTKVINLLKRRNKTIKLHVDFDDKVSVGFWMNQGFHVNTDEPILSLNNGEFNIVLQYPNPNL